jgi:pseudomonalisin
VLTASISCALSQAPAPHSLAQAGESQFVALEGNTHPLARPELDEGPVSADLPLQRMLLVLKPSPAQKADLDALLAAQQDPASPSFHRWLTPAEYGVRFGVGERERSLVVAWLRSYGFSIDEIPSGQRFIVFSGSAGQILDAFHTEIHRYHVAGVTHIANSQDPQIPAALADVLYGVLSLHDFRRTAQLKTRAAANPQPAYSAGSTHYLFPADFAAIYDLNPLYNDGITGNGAAIAIAGRSNIALNDVAAFRSLSGLPPNTPVVTVDGADPGWVANDQDESTLDVEWSGAVAPQASINLVIAASTATTDGIDLAAATIVNRAAAPIVSLSYSSCEQQMGAAELAFYNDLWQQAAAEGISVFVASGDAGAAGCAAGPDNSGSQTAVNGLCSSPYATCVGGTEFNESSNSSEYWSAANSAAYESALGYIPEVVWNESAANHGAGLWASGGGTSTVYPQPAWQANVSGAAEAAGMRAVPDVALAAADHDGAFVIVNGSRFIASGTSVASPDFAGLMALVDQKQRGAAQGMVNSTLYSMAGAENNPFHATPSGNNSVPGVIGFTASGATYNFATGLGSVDGAVLVNNWGIEADMPVAQRPVRCPQIGPLPAACRAPLPWPTPHETGEDR